MIIIIRNLRLLKNDSLGFIRICTVLFSFSFTTRWFQFLPWKPKENWSPTANLHQQFPMAAPGFYISSPENNIRFPILCEHIWDHWAQSQSFLSGAEYVHP